jgi:Fe-S-cluster-containing hydrogenase component 2
MKRIFVIDQQQCSGCLLCAISCSLHKEGYFNPRLARMNVVKQDWSGHDKPIFCWHCQRAPCVDACPTGAILRKAVNDTVVIDATRCDGCGQCRIACPFEIIKLHPVTNKAIKCDLCDGHPQCVDSCPTNVLYFTTFNEFQSVKQGNYAHLNDTLGRVKDG